MGTITLQQAAQWCGGKIDPKYKNVTFFGANNDTRKLESGQLFVALQGQRDGHDFIPQALAGGAAAILCTHCDGDWPAIVVEDTRIALGQIAREHRRQLNIKVVGVTGSVGKSTTKEMISAVLASSFWVAKTPANHNNDIGMPMAILSIPEETEIAVLEMGMNHFGEISYLTAIGKPDLAVITNIGTMHIEHLGSREGILQAKLEILEGMPEDGTLILNGDDDLLWGKRNAIDKKTTYFGFKNADAAILAENTARQDGALTFTLNTGTETFPVCLNLEGDHYILDSLAAIAVGLEMGISAERIQQSLYHFQNMPGRQEIFEKNGFTVIKDCYNAGPESMAAALTVLGNRPGRHIAVLGDMLELGVRTGAEHYKAGRVAAAKADVLLAYGPNSLHMVHGAITGGMSRARARAFTEKEQLVQTLKQLAKPGDVLLFKGSRGMRMELILEAFLEITEETV